jgi:hypothetical protein|tara:strand:+ start:3210 stop:3944 length:735 start_codon:yes stop_codon:yes gene_type:complete
MNNQFNNIFYGAVMLAFLFAYSLSYSDDNEIYVDQAGASASIDIEQLGSGNLVGGLQSTAGNMTPFDLDGASMSLDLNLIGDSNLYRGDITADSFTGVFDIDGDSNSYTIQVDPSNSNNADSSNVNVDIDGSSNTMTLDLATNSLASGADIDTIVQGSSNTVHIDLDVDSATNYIDLDGDSNTVDYNGDGYAGAYFKLEHDGGSRSFDIDQQSTLDNDWLRVISSGSNGSVCINQSDQGTSTSC